jgi:hypothetical protein
VCWGRGREGREGRTVSEHRGVYSGLECVQKVLQDSHMTRGVCCAAMSKPGYCSKL